jgi:hypothetical protein
MRGTPLYACTSVKWNMLLEINYFVNKEPLQTVPRCKPGTEKTSMIVVPKRYSSVCYQLQVIHVSFK